MESKISAVNLNNGGTCNVRYESVNVCPLCNTHLIPTKVGGAYYKAEDGESSLTVLNHCSNCCACFITTYHSIITLIDTVGNISYEATDSGYSEPKKYIYEQFPPNVATISPKFVEIYNQSKQSETMGLHQISGMGYRKALEFLIKDYAIYNNIDKKSCIESMLLSNCIKNFIDNNKIKELAEKSAWLGNDETHYIKLHPDKDVADLKRFIKACANYIEMELTLNEAKAIKKCP